MFPVAMTQVWLVGCTGGTNPPTYPTRGVVTRNGSPIDHATVTFHPMSDAGEQAVGRSDASGRFIMSTFERHDGAVAGTYKVCVFKQARESGEFPIETSPMTEELAQPDGGDEYDDPSGEEADAEKGPGPTNLLPEKYATVGKTPLKFSVAEANNTFEIELE